MLKVQSVVIEVEVKAQIDDLSEVREKIKTLGGELQSIKRQVDVYLQHPCRNFKLTDEALRLRKSNGKAYLTYKGPKLSPRSKSRLEVEVEVSDLKKTLEILVKVGFKPIGEVKKIREVWKLKEAIINLDEVENLGIFIEIEIKSKDMRKAEESIRKILEKLNIPAIKTTRKSYLEMLLEK